MSSFLWLQSSPTESLRFIVKSIGLGVISEGAIAMGWLGLLCFSASTVFAQTPRPTQEVLRSNAEKSFGTPNQATALSKENRIWVDKERKRLVVDGYVTLTQGQLEMFACPVATKEHESIVAVFADARTIHAGLLAIGAKPGSPTKFDPYQPATGSTIKIHVLWRGANNEKKVATAQSWIKDLQHEREMIYDWVFAGSVFAKDPDSGEELYYGDSGDLICVANFPTAVMDIAIKSISNNDFLVYAAYTERIPPLFTPCRLVLEVSNEAPRQNASKPAAAVSDVAPEISNATSEPSRNVIDENGKPTSPSASKGAGESKGPSSAASPAKFNDFFQSEPSPK